MKKILYLTTWDFSDGPSSGITQKIRGQMKAFEQHGFAVDYTCISQNVTYYFKDGVEYSLGKVWKLRKLAANYYLYKSLKNESYEYVYNRYGLMDIFYFKIIKQLAHKGAKIIVEIPTYPYDKERLPGLAWWILYTLDKLYRNHIWPYVYRIATYSLDKSIFQIPTVHIKNGIDFDIINVRKPEKKEDGTIHLLAVAGFTKAHGYDRMIKGLGNYYRMGGTRNIIFHMVGSGEPEAEYHRLVDEYNLSDHCIFHGVQRGENLNAIYNYCDMGVESLGDFRNGIYISSSLKSREYVAKGIPFITACESDVFEGKEFVLKITADEVPVDINDIVKFYDKMYNGKSKEEVVAMIRSSAEECCDIVRTIEPVVSCFLDK